MCMYSGLDIHVLIRCLSLYKASDSFLGPYWMHRTLIFIGWLSHSALIWLSQASTGRQCPTATQSHSSTLPNVDLTSYELHSSSRLDHLVSIHDPHYMILICHYGNGYVSRPWADGMSSISAYVYEHTKALWASVRPDGQWSDVIRLILCLWWP